MSPAVNFRVCYRNDGMPKERLSEREAQQRQVRHNLGLAPGEPRLCAYQCSLCGYWHTGHKFPREEPVSEARVRHGGV